MKVIILAAGLSKRLHPVTAKLPKCLVKVGERTLLEYTLRNFEKFGAEEVVIVTGHGGKEIERRVKVDSYCMKVTFIFNPEYAIKNNVYSLWCARSILKKGAILFNSDVFCHPRIIQRVLNLQDGNFLVIDESKELGREEMKVKISSDMIKEISKEIDPDKADGEYIGIARFSQKGGLVLSKILDEIIKNQETDVFYEAAFQRMIVHCNLFKMSTQGLLWIEIDDFVDLKRARSMWVKILDGV